MRPNSSMEKSRTNRRSDEINCANDADHAGGPLPRGIESSQKTFPAVSCDEVAEICSLFRFQRMLLNKRDVSSSVHQGLVVRNNTSHIDGLDTKLPEWAWVTRFADAACSQIVPEKLSTAIGE